MYASKYYCLHSSIITVGELLKEVLRCLSCVPFPIDLRSLSRVEEQIIDHFKAPTFCSLGNGSFLHCLSSSAEANEALGGSLIGSQACQPHIKQVKSKVLSIISQLNPDNRQKVCSNQVFYDVYTA